MHKALTTLDHTDPTLALSHSLTCHSFDHIDRTLALSTLASSYITYLSIYTYKIGLSMGNPWVDIPTPIT
jgi:hypothetical protein